jgi:hypothetical protein
MPFNFLLLLLANKNLIIIKKFYLKLEKLEKKKIIINKLKLITIHIYNKYICLKSGWFSKKISIN